MSRKILWRLQGESVNIDFTQNGKNTWKHKIASEKEERQIKTVHAPAALKEAHSEGKSERLEIMNSSKAGALRKKRTNKKKKFNLISFFMLGSSSRRKMKMSYRATTSNVITQEEEMYTEPCAVLAWWIRLNWDLKNEENIRFRFSFSSAARTHSQLHAFLFSFNIFTTEKVHKDLSWCWCRAM